MKENKIVIVVPVYKNDIDYYEKISLMQLFKVLGKYPICFIMPKTFDFRRDLFDFGDYYIERFNNSFFSGVSEYGKLCLSESFYSRFEKYEYMLIYQLDAFVFDDRIEEFINYGYDYYGAPWDYGQFCFKSYKENSWFVGNGGFSLRRISKCKNIVCEKEKILANMPGDIEDILLCSSAGSDFNVAPIKIARMFSIETNVRDNLAIVFPFGCHAWMTYDYETWKRHIEKEGYNLPDLIDGGARDSNDRVNKYRDFCEKRVAYWKNEFSIKRLKDDICRAFVGEDRKYAIWGIGVCGKMLCSLMQSCGLDIEIIVDAKAKDNMSYEGVSVIEPECYARMIKQYRMIIAIWKIDAQIIEYLNKLKSIYKEDYIYIYDIDEIDINKNYYPQNRRQLAI